MALKITRRLFPVMSYCSCLDFLTVAFWLDGLADDPGWRLWGFPINCRFSYHGVPVPRFKFNASTLLKGKTGVLTP